ncbi:MAG TPA: mobile mystery protein A [Micropepsaceae bacterium]|nr:mobile mystery protein A [Micropepsaceae bacterium]
MSNEPVFLDEKFDVLRPAARIAAPARGWIKAIREALGMTTAQMARRMGVSQPRVVELEAGEISGSISLKSLKRAAEALDCRAVVLLVPERRISDVLHERAAQKADAHLNAVDQTMRLEDQQTVDAKRRKRLRAELIEQLMAHPKQLWDHG